MGVRFSVCLNAVFGHLPRAQALSHVHAAGVKDCEFWGWMDEDIPSIRQAREKYQLHLAAMCVKFPPLTDGKRHDLVLPGLEETIAVCNALQCGGLIVQTGPDVPGLSRKEQYENVLRALRMCVPTLEKAGVTLLLEPLNTKVDHQGYFLAHAQEAFDLVEEAGSSHVKVLYDIYHQHITEGVSIPLLEKNIDKIGHFHMAGHPGRHEPMVADEIDYPAILQAIEGTGYKGCVGLEYFPVGDADASLKATLEKLNALFA